MRLGTRVVVMLALVVFEAPAHAGNVLNISNGVTGPGHVDIDTDDFGTFGSLLGATMDDQFQPIGATQQSATAFAGAYLVVTTSDGLSSAISLTDNTTWRGLVEPGPPPGDGIIGTHPQLTRTITGPNALVTASEARSTFTFTVPDPQKPVGLAISLDQKLTWDAGAQVTTLLQTYAITNTGTLAATLIFDTQWDLALPWSGGGVPGADDVVGTPAGRCFVYQRESGSTANAVALGDAGSDVAITYYYGAKQGVVPGAGPAYDLSTDVTVFKSSGTPAGWRNHIANVGYSTPGESGTSPGADAMIGTEYAFALAPGASKALRIARYYGTIAPQQCPVSTSCGDGVIDPGEACDSGGNDDATCNGSTCTSNVCGDGHSNIAAGETCDSGGTDTATCIGATCRESSCGDGHTNPLAGEQCDSGGVDQRDCNARLCSIPACGDGYVNVAAGEECDGSRYCDPDCTFNFTLGGGCAGCASGTPGSLLLGCGVVAWLWRRRRSRLRAR